MKDPFRRDILRLGFGCAQLRGGWEWSASIRLLEQAYDSGIRYFDTARLYAQGESEGVLGAFLRKGHEDVIVTSKAGILPAPGGALRRWVRRGQNLSSRILRTKPPRPLEPRFGVFDIASLHKSVETSLRNLRRSRLDALLLHEVDEMDLADGAVFALLKDMQTRGKIGSYGVASTKDQTRRLIAAHGDHLEIVQIASTILDDGLVGLGDRIRFFTITHSVLTGSMREIVSSLALDEKLRAYWIAHVDVDPADPNAIALLLLAEALDSNPNGLVLFSSINPGHIAAAARVARDNPYATEQIHGLREFAGEILQSRYKGY